MSRETLKCLFFAAMALVLAFFTHNLARLTFFGLADLAARFAGCDGRAPSFESTFDKVGSAAFSVNARSVPTGLFRTVPGFAIVAATILGSSVSCEALFECVGTHTPRFKRSFHAGRSNRQFEKT